MLPRILVLSQTRPGLEGAAWQGGGQPPGGAARGWGLREGVRGEAEGRRSLPCGPGWWETQRACEQGPRAGSRCRRPGLVGA